MATFYIGIHTEEIFLKYIYYILLIYRLIPRAERTFFFNMSNVCATCNGWYVYGCSWKCHRLGIIARCTSVFEWALCICYSFTLFVCVACLPSLIYTYNGAHRYYHPRERKCIWVERNVQLKMDKWILYSWIDLQSKNLCELVRILYDTTLLNVFPKVCVCVSVPVIFGNPSLSISPDAFLFIDLVRLSWGQKCHGHVKIKNIYGFDTIAETWNTNRG